jgi:hypothetical protein
VIGAMVVPVSTAIVGASARRRMIIIETFARGGQQTAPHPLRSRSESIPHDLVAADPQIPRHSLFLPARRR